jgi:general stress protein 26
MPTQQGDLALLNDPIAQELLHSQIPARVAYVWTDGTPRVVPIWFHWNGKEIVLGTPVDAPKVNALRQNPKVAVTIDDNNWPAKVLLIRGSATVEIVDGVVPEYAAAAARYFGPEQGEAWVEQTKGLMPQVARLAIRPEWVAVLDFEQRFPNALERAMGM